MVTTPIIKKKISRRKPGSKPTKNYFDDDTQAAIIRYQEAVVPEPDGLTKPNFSLRNLIYLHDILPAFSTLVENLINVYGYHVLYDSKDDLKNECLEFLYTTLDKWKRDRGTKAFSYFNIIAMHWLTIKSKLNVKIAHNYVSLDNRESLSKQDLHLIEERNYCPSAEDLLINDDISKMLPQLIENLRGRAKTANEQIVLDAIEIIVKDIEDIELLSKRAVMLLIRQITNISSKQLSIVLSALKKQYKIAKEEMTK